MKLFGYPKTIQNIAPETPPQNFHPKKFSQPNPLKILLTEFPPQKNIQFVHYKILGYIGHPDTWGMKEKLASDNPVAWGDGFVAAFEAELKVQYGTIFRNEQIGYLFFGGKFCEQNFERIWLGELFWVKILWGVFI